MKLWDTFYDQIRSSVGGMDNFDMPDSILASWGLEDEVEVDLSGWYPDYDKVNLQESSKQATLLRVYIRNFAAAICCRVGFGFINKSWTDGNGKWERFEGDWDTLSKELASKAEQVKQRILTELGIAATTASLRPTMLGISSPDRDPVTEPRSS